MNDKFPGFRWYDHVVAALVVVSSICCIGVYAADLLGWLAD